MLTYRFRIVFALLLLLACCSSLVAQEKIVYQPAGAPANPKVEVRWNKYHDYAEATDLLQNLVKAHPDLCKLQSLGKSFGGREMWVLSITNTKQGREDEKAAFWIDGCIHANEIQATEVVLYTAWYLAESYGRSPQVTKLLNERVFYLMPIMSPDARDAHMAKPNTTHSPRSGLRPVDDDRDGRTDEDGADDLDGDGHITQMRIKDPNGRYKPHDDYPDLLIPVEGDERGSYTLLGIEGLDNDRDGRVNEDGDGFYDPNRDWAWNWQPDYVQNGAHRYPFSILENRMVADFIRAHPNIAGAQSYHNTGGMILHGPGVKEDRFEPADLAVYQLIGKRGEQMLPGYRLMNIAEDLYVVYGGEVDWLHEMQGVFTYTNELFTPFNYFRKSSEESLLGRQEDQRAFEKYLLLGDGAVKWHEVDHPQYGKIDVGGPKKNWVRQPPSFLLEEECHRNMAFTLYHADQLPLVRVQSIETSKLGEGLVEVTAVVINDRITPTHSAADLNNKLTPPDVVSIEGTDVKVVAGMHDNEQFFIRPEVQKRDPAKIKIPTIGGMRAVYVRWIVEGSEPFTVRVKSVKGGVDSMSRG
jgi:hypothetical protein